MILTDASLGIAYIHIEVFSFTWASIKTVLETSFLQRLSHKKALPLDCLIKVTLKLELIFHPLKVAK